MADVSYEDLKKIWAKDQEVNNACGDNNIESSTSITNRVYNKPHVFLDESYNSRSGWYNPTKGNSYLIPHAKEDEYNYNNRKTISTYDNFLKSIVNTVVDPLFKGDISVDIKSSNIAFNTVINSFIDSFDLKVFLMETMQSFKLHDMVETIIEPMEETEGIESIIPEIYSIDIDNILDVKKLNKQPIELTFRMEKTFIDDKGCKVDYYTITVYGLNSFVTTTQLYRDKEGKYYSGDNLPKDDTSLTRVTIDDNTITGYNYDRLPIVDVRKKITTTINSTPDMWDLAIACWDYFNIKSLLRELYKKVTFPMLTMQSDSEIDSITIGLNNMLKYPTTSEKPEYLKLDTAAHVELRTGMSEQKQIIYKLFLQGLQTDETQFTSEDSNKISESLFLNHVNFLSKYLEKYTKELFANVAYVMLDGKTNIEILKKLNNDIEIDYNFDFSLDKDVTLEIYQLLADLTQDSEDMIFKDKLIKEIAKKAKLTDKDNTLQE